MFHWKRQSHWPKGLQQHRLKPRSFSAIFQSSLTIQLRDRVLNTAFHHAIFYSFIYIFIYCLSGTNPCGTENGNCSHLCLISPGGSSYTCACPDDFTLLPDARTCDASCSAAQFLCSPTDHRCIPATWRCDGEVDCVGGNDEAGCREWQTWISNHMSSKVWGEITYALLAPL